VRPVTILAATMLLLLASACGQNYTPEDEEKEPSEDTKEQEESWTIKDEKPEEK